ncbi:uncharacterized protein FMAN_11774 [Fusarium mangiferae]|uniref:2EXR domain-containing protein n=1 Tax=Fusarium mangiferae TaxID=192010 RepID=A0A1L7UF17_FUSMA|nr:uncharacterized protein FMAN_11774 [Fusarium mangiferae]CVL06615.1 uncharacterized protein FMAN_11774 [Fusarium mangiferae]
MDTTTFHSFPRLPFELREQIWQDTCLPLRPRERRRNIHYLYMDESRNIWPRDYDWKTDDPRSRCGYTWHTYIWHVGLWTACRESYDVVRKFENHYLGCPRPRRCMRVVCPPKSDPLPQDQVIDLTQDICVITTDSWESLLRPWRPIYLQTEDARGRRRLMKPLNIGVKFDPLWSEEMQKAVETTYFATVLRDLYPPMAFAIRLLFQFATEVRFSFGRSKVMLIDDVSEWKSFDTEGHGGCRIFDSGQEYVELGYVMGFSTHIPHPDSPMDDFLENLSYLFMGKLNEAADWHSRAHVLDTDYLIAVLRRDKQVPMIR